MFLPGGGLCFLFGETPGCIHAPQYRGLSFLRQLQGGDRRWASVLGPARWCVTLYPRGSGGQPDRLCHKWAWAVVPDDRPAHRRRAGRNLLAGREFLAPFILRGYGLGPHMARPWARRGGARHVRPFRRASFREYPELLTSRPLLGYCMAAAFAIGGRFFAYLGRRALCRVPRCSALSPAAGRFYFGAPALGYFFGNWISGRVSRFGAGNQRDDPLGAR